MKNTLKNVRTLLPCLTAWLVVGSSAHAGIIFTGSISNADGNLIGNSAWKTGSSLSWEVSYDSTTQFWTYDYQLGVSSKAVSHLILGLCPTLEKYNFSTISGSDNDVETIGTFTTTGQGASNPGLPADVYGLKIETSGDPENLSFKLVTSASPGWGDFYAKSGKVKGEEVYMFNSGFAASNPIAPASNGSFNGHVLIPSCGLDPDPILTPIPEPSAVIGLAGLLFAGGLFARRRN